MSEAGAERRVMNVPRISPGSNRSVTVKPCRPPRKPKREQREPAPMCSPCLNRPRSRSSKKSVLCQMFSFTLNFSGLLCGECLLCLLETQHVTIQLLQAFTIMDQNRDGFIDKNDLRDTFAALGKTTSASVCVFMSLLCCEGFSS